MDLITGGTGLVGSHLLFELTAQGKRVRAIRRRDSNLTSVNNLFRRYSGKGDALFAQIEWVEADILDNASLEDAMEGISQVYHAAALVSFDPKDRKEMLRVNVDGTANVVNACLEKKIRKLCHVSSIASLGRNATKGVVTEESHWKASPENSYYAISKYGAEREVWRGTEEGLDAVLVNPALIIGPGDWNKGSIAVFKLAAKGLKFYTSGRTGYVDARDVARAMILLMESTIKNERFILSAGNMDFREFFDALHQEFGKPNARIPVKPLLAEFGWRMESILARLGSRAPAITRETARAANYRYEFSSEKIERMTGFRFIPIRDSIRQICFYYTQDNP
jgi:dihydroflavonol-4-reductase